MKAFLAALLCFSGGLCAQTQIQNQCDNTPAYAPCEIVFELPANPAAHPSPYTDVDLKVEFRSPDMHTLTMPGFWDGGRRMVVRLTPLQAGKWDYMVESNIPEWNDQTGSFMAIAGDKRGFIRPANVHHWEYTEKTEDDMDQPHLWMGATDLRMGFEDDAAFKAMADERAAEKFNHLRGLVLGTGAVANGAAAYQGPDSPNVNYFRRLDARVRYLNEKGIIADLTLAATPGDLVKAFASADQRRRFVRYVVARYAPMNVTWQAVDEWEGMLNARGIVKEIGAALKEMDTYGHPRTSCARVTSTPLLDDGWMDFAAHGNGDDQVAAIEHQLYTVPFVDFDFAPGVREADTFRHRLWNAFMDGQYLTAAGPEGAPGADAKAMTVMYNFLAGTRYWELEPYFDVDGGRAVALDDVEYVVYIEKPGPIELLVKKHGYDVFWLNPGTGESVREKKKFSGDHFTGQPPDNSHDWVLHVVRQSHLEGMNRSYKLESREIGMQVVEANTQKVPFTIDQPKSDIARSKPAAYAAKMTKETRAARTMMWLWEGEVAADHQGYRILATGQQGTFTVPADIAQNYPAIMHYRLYGMNANGKVYELDGACGIEP